MGILSILLLTACANPAPKPTHVLIFSKTAAFRHDSIETAVAAIKEAGVAKNLEFEATEDSGMFNAKDLARFKAVVFLSTTGDVLNDAQQIEFEKFITKGGGYCGIHAAADTEYDWPFYGETVGAYFQNHPAIQKVTINVEDTKHPTTSFLPKVWERTDELYNYKANPRKNVKVLASYDEKSYKGGTMGDHPIMWHHTQGKGRCWYTGMGHTKESYKEPLFVESVMRGILWSARKL
ncbi:MAG: ThuA domain-containing protein [Armatimonadetes bacterium]|nr:ThuA domain-containing protein [Armatimonadota bacterium]